MSRSFIARTRFQSVPETLEEEDLFTSSGPSKGDHVDAFSGLRMHDRNSDLAQKTERYEALLATGEAVVLVRCRETFEYALGVSKVKTVISKIRPSLSLIPRKAHRHPMGRRCGVR